MEQPVQLSLKIYRIKSKCHFIIQGEASVCVRMEDSGRVDDENRPILERVDLMEAFFAGVHRQI